VYATRAPLSPLLGVALMMTLTALAWGVTRPADDAGPAGPVCIKPPQPVDPLTAYRFDSPAGPIAAQTDADGKLWCWGQAVKQGEGMVFKPSPWPKDNPSAGVTVTQVKEGLIEVKIDGQPFTEFHWGEDEIKPYLWPVIGPTGSPVTRAYPMKDIEGERKDHPHHRSIWSAWGDVRTSDLSKPGTNYWAQAKNPKDQDRQVVRKIVRTASGPVFGQIVADIDWVSRTGQGEFSEVRTYTFYRGDDDNRLIDVRNVFAFDDGDVMFADTKEAGVLSLRIATSMDEITLDRKPGKGRITNSRGETGGGDKPGNCWGRPADWCDYTGPVEGKTIGIAVFDKPGNPGHPPRWHIRDYGLFAVNNYGLKDFPDGKGKNGSHLFKKDEHQAFDYRIVIHKGDAQAARVADQYKLYADNPTAKIK